MINFIKNGENTKDATATPDDILSPKTAYVNGEKITGNIESTYIDLTNIESSIGQTDTIAIKYVGRRHIVIINPENFKVYFIEDNKSLTLIDTYTFTTSELKNIQVDNFTVSEFTPENDIRFIFTDKYKVNNLYYFRFDKDSNTIINVGTFNLLDVSQYTNNGFTVCISHNGLRLVECITQTLHSNGFEMHLINVSATALTVNTKLYSVKYGRQNATIQFLNNDQLISVSHLKLNTNDDCENHQIVLNASYNKSTQYRTVYNNKTSMVYNNNLEYCYTGNEIYTVKYENNQYKPDALVTSVGEEMEFKGFLANEYVIFNNTIYKIDTTLQMALTCSFGIDNGIVNTAYINRKTATTETIVLDTDSSNLHILNAISAQNTDLYNLNDVITAQNKVLEGYKYGSSSGIISGTMANNGDVTVSPSTQQQTKSQGYYNSLIIEAVDNTIDSNIIAANIKKNVQILGVAGTYEGDTVVSNKKKLSELQIGDVITKVSTKKSIPIFSPTLGTGVQLIKDSTNDTHTIELNPITTDSDYDTLNVTIFEDTSTVLYKYYNNAWSRESVEDVTLTTPITVGTITSDFICIAGLDDVLEFEIQV